MSFFPPRVFEVAREVSRVLAPQGKASPKADLRVQESTYKSVRGPGAAKRGSMRSEI